MKPETPETQVYVHMKERFRFQGSIRTVLCLARFSRRAGVSSPGFCALQKTCESSVHALKNVETNCLAVAQQRRKKGYSLQRSSDTYASTHIWSYALDLAAFISDHTSSGHSCHKTISTQTAGLPCREYVTDRTCVRPQGACSR